MAWTRPTEAQLKQFASQCGHVSVDELRTVERYLPEDETPDFLMGLLIGLKIAYEMKTQPESLGALGKVVAIIAERIVNMPQCSEIHNNPPHDPEPPNESPRVLLGLDNQAI